MGRKILPGGHEIVGQHWSSFFSTTQFFPTGLINGQTLIKSKILKFLEKKVKKAYLRKHISI